MSVSNKSLCFTQFHGPKRVWYNLQSGTFLSASLVLCESQTSLVFGDECSAQHFWSAWFLDVINAGSGVHYYMITFSPMSLDSLNFLKKGKRRKYISVHQVYFYFYLSCQLACISWTDFFRMATAATQPCEALGWSSIHGGCFKGIE